MTTDAELIRELDDSDESEHSMEVLLQLTLPMVLILALIVVTEVASLERENEKLRSDLQDTPTGDLGEIADETILELQHQLLIKASAEIADEQIKTLGLPTYREVAPSATDVLAGSFSKPFTVTTRALAERFNGSHLRAGYTREFREVVLKRFREFTDEAIRRRPEMGKSRGVELHKLSDENFAAMATAIDGELTNIERAGREAQLHIVYEWLTAEATADLRLDTSGMWRRILDGEREEIETLVNLKVRNLFERLKDGGAELLESTESVTQ
ncbi:MAG: hypothetical protein AB2809_07430 [Candidatus Thiodiazotropha sp.]